LTDLLFMGYVMSGHDILGVIGYWVLGIRYWVVGIGYLLSFLTVFSSSDECLMNNGIHYCEEEGKNGKDTVYN